MLRLRPRYIDDWATVTRSLYRGTWKSSALACRVFEGTPHLLETLSFDELCHFGNFLEVLSRRSYDLAGESLGQAMELFPRIGADSDYFIALARAVAESSWRDVKNLFDAALVALPELPSAQRVALLSLARRLAASGKANPGSVLRDGSAAIIRAPIEARDRLLQLTDGLAAVSPAAAPEFLRTAPSVLERVTFAQLTEWHAEGAALSRDNPEAGIAYFRLESARSEGVLDALSSSIDLNRIRDVIRMYCRALAGRDIEVNAAQQLVDKNIGWFQGELPTTEGTTIYLPSVINNFAAIDRNFGFYKVISTHQVGHIEFGSFDFDFDRPSNIFPDLRPRLPVAAVQNAPPAEQAEAPVQPDLLENESAETPEAPCSC